MKILFLSFYSGVTDRGAETYVHELAERLSANSEVTVCQTGPVKKGANYKTRRIKLSAVTDTSSTTNLFRRLFITPRQLQEFRFYVASLKTIKSTRPQVVMPINSGWQTPLLKLASLIYAFKLVISGQSGPGWDDRWNLLWRPSLFVALTKTQLSWAKKVSPKQKYALIPNGVDTHKFTPQGRKLKLNLPRPIVLAVAASIPSKRLETTIKAVEAANASLLIVGSGYLEEHLDRMGKKLLGQRYRRIQLPHSKMPAAYRAADIFTLCSDHSEAFGIVYLEALASGLPVVATDDASRREIVGPSGFYVKNPDETEEYASAIKRAISFKQTKNLITQAEKYSWEEISSLYEQELADTVILLRGEE